MPASFSSRASTNVTPTLSAAFPVTTIVSPVCRALAAGVMMVTVGAVTSGASCVTVTTLPAIFSFAVRDVAPEFGSQLRTTSPPVSEASETIPSHVAIAVVLTAFQLQPSVAVTMIASAIPPAAVKVTAFVLRLYAQLSLSLMVSVASMKLPPSEPPLSSTSTVSFAS